MVLNNILIQAKTVLNMRKQTSLLALVIVLTVTCMFLYFDEEPRPKTITRYRTITRYNNTVPVPHLRRVGFFLIGTGKYLELVNQLIESMEEHFCTKKQAYVHYFVFTDVASWSPTLEDTFYRNYTIIHQDKLAWPMSTLLRFEIIINQTNNLRLDTFDYLYWIDSDMRMVDTICDDLFGDLVGTVHPHYISSNKRYPYESSNKKSTAYLDQSNRYEHPYYVGALYGGNYYEMMALLRTCSKNIQYDYNNLNGFVAIVHDESHLNRYSNAFYENYYVELPFF